MALDDAADALTGWLGRLVGRRARPQGLLHAADAELIYPSRALAPFLAELQRRTRPSVLDLGPVIGSNVAFLGERCGCKIICEDLYGEFDRAVRRGEGATFPAAVAKRITQPDASVDGILCWDLFDYLDRASAKALASRLVRVLKPEGVMLAFFGVSAPPGAHFTRYLLVDERQIQRQPYPTTIERGPELTNRAIIGLFAGMQVLESVLLTSCLREVVFRKPSRLDIR